MKKTVTVAGYTFIAISCLSLIYVSVLAWLNPREVMALVQVELTNNDALSSIRGVYGGVGISLVTLIVIMAVKNLKSSLLFLSGFWFMYAISRVITILQDGPLGDFGNTWIKIETMFGIVAFTLYYLIKSFQHSRVKTAKNQQKLSLQKTAH